MSSIEPRYIGYGGGAITIYGEGFSEDVFNQFDPILGNKVGTLNTNLTFILFIYVKRNLFVKMIEGIKKDTFSVWSDH